ncbi:MAG: DHH family phosphoesterase [Lachnospiraceae bacterium]|nr:DHH family phosphoesterase [Lachnospiraceae bacterium]
MRLSQLLEYDPIIVQCHDNPDADAIASGYAVYCYFKSHSKNVRFVYSGKNAIQKSNLLLLVNYLKIGDVLEHIEEWQQDEFEGLVVTVDCQYGAGNVSRIPAKYAAIIDHHQKEIEDVELSEIVSGLGSCSTLVWRMLREEGFDLEDIKINTALYFGLYTDTNSLSEINNPFDKDMRDMIAYEKSVIIILRNSNFSLDELEIAGNAMKNYLYYPKNRFAVIKAKQCDPNILGLISDFLLQVAEVDEAIVYNEWPGGFKYSIRTCVKEVQADELASFIAEGIGSGGGHREKAGGFIRRDLYEAKFGDLDTEEFFRNRVDEYFETFEVIYASEYEADISKMELYAKKKIHQGFVIARDILPIGTPVIVRTLEGDIETEVTEDLVFMIGIKGEVYTNHREKFERSYIMTDIDYLSDDELLKPEYLPTVHSRNDGTVIDISKHAHVCISSGVTQICAAPIDKRVKIFTKWYTETYMSGKPGDYLAVRTDDPHDVYIVERDIFFRTYEKMDQSM